MLDKIIKMLDEGIVNGRDYGSIANHLGGYEIQFVDWYDNPGFRGFAQSGKPDHYITFMTEDRTKVYIYDQPYALEGYMNIGDEILGFKLLFEDSRSLYNEQTITRLWCIDVSDYSLYRTKGCKVERPTTIVNVRLDDSDRKFKNLIEIRE